MDKAEMAQANFLKGYNCAQSVLLAFAPECGLSEETAAKLASSFGGGVARLREVCGAVSGMAMAAGLIKGYADPADRQAKIDHYALVQAMAAEFRAEFGTILCRELLKDIATTAGGEPEPRTPEYYEKRRRCGLCIARAAAIAQKYLLAPDGKDA